MHLGLVRADGQTREANAPDMIALGSKKLSIGMPRDTVIAGLSSEGYQMTGQETDTLLVGTSSELVAAVEFKEGKVSSVRKYWGPANEVKGVEFARSLYGVLASFSAEGKTDCSISVDQIQEPGWEHKNAYILCGRKAIEIGIGHSAKVGEFATVDEVLGR